MKKVEKLASLAKALHNVANWGKTDIKRFELRRIVMWTLEITDAHTINNWIEILLGKKLVALSDKSEYHKKPSKNTVYTINLNECVAYE